MAMKRRRAKPPQTTRKQRRAAYDSPWKMAIERLFPHFMEFFFPDLHALIDWSCRYKFLAQELAQISAGIESELKPQTRAYHRGKRVPLRVDLLVEVYFNDGRKGRILLHLEIQNERDPFFDERLFIYHYRIFDKTREPMITLALLTDFDPAWRPGRYVRELAGCRIELNFPIRKFTDYNDEELAASRNPFAFIARAHREARTTGDDMNRRYDLRMVLQDTVEASGMKAHEVLSVTRFIEDVMRLPEDLHRKLFFERVARKEKAMEFTTYAERVGERKGIKKGKLLGKIETQKANVLRLLEVRFSKVPKRIVAKVSELTDFALLTELFDAAAQCSSLKEFEAQLPASGVRPSSARRRTA
jgi:hypothetical protein